MNKKSSWFTLEPFVYVSIKKENLFLYNTLNGKKREYHNKPILINLIKKLQEKNNLLVIKLENDYITGNREISNFIKDVRECFMGDLIEPSSGTIKPIQIMPYLKIERDIHQKETYSTFNIGEDIMNHFKEITLYINNRCKRNCEICGNAYKQFFHCHKERDHRSELNTRSIQKIIEATRRSRIHRINILGGNIFKHSTFGTLVSLLNLTGIPKSYYIHYLNLENQKESVILINSELSELNILVKFPVKKNIFENLMSLITRIDINTVFTIIVEKENDIEDAQQLISQFDIKNHSITPYFNGRNLPFFEKYVFITEKNILESKPSIMDILSKGALNRSLYGKITILSNGDVKSNLNFDKIGNIKKETIHEIIYNQLRDGKTSILYNTWWRTRDHVEPCRQCHYNMLCPSISNYELVLRRNNLCHILEKSLAFISP